MAAGLDIASAPNIHTYIYRDIGCCSFFCHECQTKFINTAIMMSFTVTIAIAKQFTI